MYCYNDNSLKRQNGSKERTDEQLSQVVLAYANYTWHILLEVLPENTHILFNFYGKKHMH